MKSEKDGSKDSPDSSGHSPKKKFTKGSSFVLSESALKLNFNEMSFSPANQKSYLKSLSKEKEKEKEKRKNEDFEFSGVGGFFTASDIMYTQNERQTVYYLEENESVISETVTFDNLVTIESCKLLVTDNLKNIGSSLIIEAIDKFRKTLRRRTTTLSKGTDKKDQKEKTRENTEREAMDDEEYFNQKTNCMLPLSRLQGTRKKDFPFRLQDHLPSIQRVQRREW